MHPDVQRLEQLSRVSVSVPVHEDPLRFPIEALPPVLRQFATETAAALPVPVDLIAVPSLVCAGAAIGARHAIRLKPGWTERPALYAALVQPPGTLKTPALTAAAAPVQTRQAELSAGYRTALQVYETEQANYTREFDAYRKGKREEPPERPEKPIRARTWTADVTVERQATLLAENPRGVLILRDELTAWVKSLNQYKGGKGSDRQFYLSAWSGAAVAVDRQGKEPVLIDHPFLAVVGCVPPDVLPELDDEGGKEDGFIHRVLFAYPEPVPVRWTEATVAPAVATAYDALFRQLYDLPPPDGQPIILGLTLEAQRFFRDWHDDHCRETEGETLPLGLRGFYCKLKGYGARLALIHALCTDPTASVVGVESVAAAADLVDYFKAHAAKVAPLLIRKKVSPHEKCEREIRSMLAGGRVLTRREVQRYGNSPAPLFNEVWEALLRADQLVEVEKPGNRGPRKGYRLAEDGE